MFSYCLRRRHSAKYNISFFFKYKNPCWYRQMSAVWTWLKEENADRSRTDWFSELGFETALTVAIDFLLTALLEVIIGLMNSFHTDCLTLSMERKALLPHIFISKSKENERAATKPSNVLTQKLWNDAKQYNMAKIKVFNLIKLWLSQTSHWPLCCLSCLAALREVFE